MSETIETSTPAGLRNYYFVRAAVAALWVVAAVTVGAASPAIAACLLVAYPAWDAAANLADAVRSGGIARNPIQALNVVVSVATAALVLVVIKDMHAVLAVFGGWAIFAGLLQLTVGVRRWKTNGAQWSMILSGAQSALAGTFFIGRAHGSAMSAITDLAGYAGFGAFYFLISALWLSLRRSSKGGAR